LLCHTLPSSVLLQHLGSIYYGQHNDVSLKTTEIKLLFYEKIMASHKKKKVTESAIANSVTFFGFFL